MKKYDNFIQFNLFYNFILAEINIFYNGIFSFNQFMKTDKVDHELMKSFKVG